MADRSSCATKQTEKLVKIKDSALFASRSQKLKDLQLGVIKSFVGGKDVFAILPMHWVCEEIIVLCMSPHTPGPPP